MTEDQFIERVGEEMDDSLDRPIWSDVILDRGKGVPHPYPGPTLSDLLRAIYRVLQEGK